ncbi:D-2-hydroxyacid dehydrogenase family protein [Bacillus salitolerans]|uniref:D-2-hydroxyacid dehydrogenase family protein n=1 Tax=Bacillus salitolerans TaxID=1437434 RepID=A0ABW4LQE6_9BACI
MKLVILDDWENFFYNNDKIEELRNHFDVEIFHDKPTSEVLIERIKHADVIIPIRERTIFSKEVLREMRCIKLIAQTGTGLAHIDLEEATRLGIPVATTPGGSSAVVELIFGFIIAHSRNLIPLDQNMKNGLWDEPIGIGLENKTIGIIGLGKIGTGVAKVAKAFNMNVIAWGPRLTKERALEQNVVYSDFEQLLQKSHFVVIAVRLVPQTKHLLTESHFNMMRRDAFLINTSRGEVVDEEALLIALKENKIGGAGLDVFSVEPLFSDHPILKLTNVILSPHIGWKTDKMFHNFLSVSIENIISYIFHKQPIRIANLEVLNTNS